LGTPVGIPPDDRTVQRRTRSNDRQVRREARLVGPAFRGAVRASRLTRSVEQSRTSTFAHDCHHRRSRWKGRGSRLAWQ
jgi:hypothetical protein